MARSPRSSGLSPTRNPPAGGFRVGERPDERGDRAMATLLNPYLGFRDTAREAMEFYRTVFGGELTVSTFADFQASDDPAEQDKVMHSMLAAGHGLTLMVADTPNRMASV